MENTATPITPSAVAVRYGLIIGLVSIIVSFALSTAQLDQTPAKWLTTIILLAGIWVAQNNFKRQNSGFMSYGQGLTVGTVLSAVVAVLTAVYSYLYLNFIDADAIGRIMDKARSDMEARGNMTDAQMDQALGMTEKFVNGPLMVATVLFIVILTGFLASLVISAIVKNPRPEFE